MHIYIAIAISALIDGLFAGFYTRAGVDASPSGIGLQIINSLTPFLPTEFEPQIEFVKMMIFAIPIIITVITLLIAPDKRIGFGIWIVVLLSSYWFFGFY